MVLSYVVLRRVRVLYNSGVAMELIIKDFISNVSLIQSFIMDLWISIESSKGLYSIYLCSFPLFTTAIVTADYIHIHAINHTIRNLNLADIIAVIGTIDFVLGSVDLVIVHTLHTRT